MDVSLPALSLSPSEFVFFGLQVNSQDGDNDPTNDVFSLGYNSRVGSTHQFTSSTPSGTVSSECDPQHPCSDLAAIRLRFDAKDDNTLFAEFDPNAGTDGYNWVTLSAIKKFVPDTVFAFGQSMGPAIGSADNVYGTNVVTTAVFVPEPSTYAMLFLGGLLGWLIRAFRARAGLPDAMHADALVST